MATRHTALPGLTLNRLFIEDLMGAERADPQSEQEKQARQADPRRS